jgi:hypothetical protein
MIQLCVQKAKVLAGPRSKAGNSPVLPVASKYSEWVCVYLPVPLFKIQHQGQGRPHLAQAMGQEQTALLDFILSSLFNRGRICWAMLDEVVKFVKAGASVTWALPSRFPLPTMKINLGTELRLR